MFGLGLGVGFSGFGGFTPKSLPGLAAWYRADKGITIGTGVSAWADQSGSGDPNKNLGSSGVGSQQPTLNSSDAAYNNQVTLSFAAANFQHMVSGAWAVSVSQPYSAFAVGNGDGATANEYFADGIVLDSGDLLAATVNAGKPAIYAGAAVFGGTATASPMVVGGDFNGASSALYQSALTAAATGNAGTSGRTGLTVGCAANISGGFLPGKIAEIVIYNRQLSSHERGQLLSYFGVRYGISIGP